MLTIMQGDGRKVPGMVYKFSCSVKLDIPVPQLDFWLMHNILDIIDWVFPVT